MNRPGNTVVLKKLLVIALGMFGFGFAMVPFYNTICRVTGINSGDEQVLVANTQVDYGRTVRLELDSNVDAGLPWTFRPVERMVDVHPGEMTQVMFEAENLTDRSIKGQAIPSYAPQRAALYFKKIECFCFSQQVLGPHEKRRMPVLFVVKPDMPDDIATITLSYTFYSRDDVAMGDAATKQTLS
jgi:cytochrome c oxidase assembly protein subunit 11